MAEAAKQKGESLRIFRPVHPESLSMLETYTTFFGQLEDFIMTPQLKLSLFYRSRNRRGSLANIQDDVINPLPPDAKDSLTLKAIQLRSKLRTDRTLAIELEFEDENQRVLNSKRMFSERFTSLTGFKMNVHDSAVVMFGHFEPVDPGVKIKETNPTPLKDLWIEFEPIQTELTTKAAEPPLA